MNPNAFALKMLTLELRCLEVLSLLSLFCPFRTKTELLASMIGVLSKMYLLDPEYHRHLPAGPLGAVDQAVNKFIVTKY